MLKINDIAIIGAGVSSAIQTFLLQNYLELLLPKRVLHIVWALYYVYIVVEVTLNRAKYGSQQSDQPENVNFKPIVWGLKSDIFDWDKV